jgi:hypothetical protein
MAVAFGMQIIMGDPGLEVYGRTRFIPTFAPRNTPNIPEPLGESQEMRRSESYRGKVASAIHVAFGPVSWCDLRKHARYPF